jgi:hypothetical protein
MDNFQVDCQIPLTPTPVLFIAQESEHRDFLLKCTITMQDNGVPDYFSYPYISIQVHIVISAPFQLVTSRCLELHPLCSLLMGKSLDAESSPHLECHMHRTMSLCR